MAAAEDRVLKEAESWFRSKLRAESSLHDFELRLFIALADRQSELPEAYVPIDTPPTSAAPDIKAPPTEALPTTVPPASDIHRELLRLSRADDEHRGK